MLKGKHTQLTAIERSDLQQLLVWRNRPDFRRYFREYRELSCEQQTGWYENTVLCDPSFRMFAIRDLKDDKILGACGLCYIDWINRNSDISIYIGYDDSYVDDVYAPDAAKVLLQYGFQELNLHRIWAEIYAFDERKKRLFEFLRFTLDGRHRETHWSENAWHDSLFYGLLAEEFSHD